MGSRSDETLREIEQIRSGLEQKLTELESRLPIAGLGRRGAAMLAGSGVAGSVLAFGWRRLRGRKRAVKSDVQPIVVNVAPKGMVAIVAVGVAVWAGVRLYEAGQRRKREVLETGARPTVVKPIAGRQEAGAGSPSS